ncbi:hypothetical protein ACIBF1_28645 [Spirillospora sp. NPDC050679]
MHHPTPRPRRLGAKALAAALVIPLAPAAVTLAASPAAAAPAPVAFSYADCPDSLPVGADPANWICNNMIIQSGTMRIGKIDQPITKPLAMTVISGYDPAAGQTRNIFVKLRAQPLTVPGGALGIPGSDDLVPLLRLSVLPKYAGGFSLGTAADGETIRATMDQRFKINNTLLGDKCHIGTAKAPVKLDLLADMSTMEWYDDFTALGVTLKDGTFAAPATSGCGLLGGFADFRSGLPSAAGKNSATLRMYMSSKPYTELFPQMKSKAKSTARAPRLPFGLPPALKDRG